MAGLNIVLIESEAATSNDPDLSTLSSRGNSRLSRLVIDEHGRLSPRTELDREGIMRSEEWQRLKSRQVKRISGLTVSVAVGGETVLASWANSPDHPVGGVVLAGG
jgi:hypothetical protein